MNIDLLPKARLDFIPPMLARPVNELSSETGWVYELKLDGYRALVLKTRGGTTLFSRRGNNLSNNYPTITRAFSFLPDDTMIDGELVVLDEQGRHSFSSLQKSRFTPDALHFYVFDVLAYRGRDLIRLSAVFNASPKRLIAAAKKTGLGGVIGKRADSRYESGERSGAWVKYKTNKGQELVIGGYRPGTAGFEYLLVGYYEGKSLIFIAKIRNGFTPALRLEIARKFPKLRTSVCPFANLPEPASARRGEAITAEVMKKIQWLRPRLVAQIQFTEWTKGNHLRHSRFVGLRSDKRASEVI